MLTKKTLDRSKHPSLVIFRCEDVNGITTGPGSLPVSTKLGLVNATATSKLSYSQCPHRKENESQV
jgi:hypothetical protein